jgi:hypothetical protein
MNAQQKRFVYGEHFIKSVYLFSFPFIYIYIYIYTVRNSGSVRRQVATWLVNEGDGSGRGLIRVIFRRFQYVNWALYSA